MAEELTGLSSMATRHLLADLCSRIELVAHVTVRFRAAGGVEAARQVRDGADVDLLVLAEGAMRELDQEQLLVPGSLRPMFVSEVVAAVRSRDEPPAFETEEDLVGVLLAASRIAYSTGPSGAALVRLVEARGLSDLVAHKLVQAPPGVPVGELLARGDADLGFQQRSELMDLADVRVLGALPGSAAIRSVFSGAVLSSSPRPAVASEALETLASPEGRAVVRSRGMELLPVAETPGR